MSGYIARAKRGDWATPPALFEALSRQLWRDYGQAFELDVCASGDNAKCPDHYTAADDGLAQPWSRPAGWWWCNPPYGREIREWVAKAVHERGGCLLLPARVDTIWFHDHLYNEAAGAARPGVRLQFLRGRVRFVGAAAGAPFPSLVAWIDRDKGAR